MSQIESLLRLSVFVGLLVALGTWELVAPRRRLVASKPVRWFSNIALVALNSVAIRLFFVLGLVGVAAHAASRRWGVLNNVELPPLLEVVLAVICLDLAVYLQHVMFHAVPLLWRLHMVHHADPDFDVTTGLRFHTLEIGISLAIKASAVVLLGAAPLAVLVFEVLLNATSMFSHSNVRMPPGWDALLRLFVVTPDMHRVHHSMNPTETNSNFGFNAPWWDYLFGTYRSAPACGHEQMRIGLDHISPDRATWLPWLLALPFIRGTGRYPPSHRDDPSPRADTRT